MQTLTKDKEDFPQHPKEYEETSHFQSVLDREKRHLSRELVNKTIQHGSFQETTGEADAEFEKDFSGVKVYVLVAWNETYQSFVIVTSWANIYNPMAAVRSKYWSEYQLRDINDFNGGDSLEADFYYNP